MIQGNLGFCGTEHYIYGIGLESAVLSMVQRSL